MAANKKPIKDEEFSKRLQLAADNHPDCPPLHHGRLTWVVRGFKSKYKRSITTETARKWTKGEVTPRRKAMNLLAQLLMVDHSWLALGNEDEVSTNERKARNILAGATINLVAGMIELDGGHPAYPEPGDTKGTGVDIFAVIKGAQYSFKVSLGHGEGKSYTFSIPASYKDLFVLGVVRVGPFQYDILELDADIIGKHKENKGAHVSVTIDKRGTSYVVAGHRVKQLRTFAERP